jgi:hypothetical protein
MWHQPTVRHITGWYNVQLYIGPTSFDHTCFKGSLMFMPRNALNNLPTAHCDDLESVYYLLCFIIGGHSEVDLFRSRLSDMHPQIDEWMLQNRTKAVRYKRSHLRAEASEVLVQHVFQPLTSLAAKLHGFLQVRHLCQESSTPYPFSPEEDFTQFLGYFEQSIREMTGTHNFRRKKMKP